jgi:hypothetical protein
MRQSGRLRTALHDHGPSSLRWAAGRVRIRTPLLLLLSAVCLLPTAATAFPAGAEDRNGNGVEDALDAWWAGRATWDQLRSWGAPAIPASQAEAPAWPANVPRPALGPWEGGRIRLLSLGRTAAQLEVAHAAVAETGGSWQVIHSLEHFGGITVLALDPAGLRAFLSCPDKGEVLLDRDGQPALAQSRAQAGAELARSGPWELEGDWTASVAILDSGCDTAHDDLGDFSHDNKDGPPPDVGDALDWFPADSGWPVFQGYRVVGWHDVTDDFPGAVGPWDYHYHGTALASVVAGEGEIDPSLRGLAPEARLTIVKFYDFDVIWHQWAGDFLAACAWLLDHRETYRVRVALATVNWDVDAGISVAMSDLMAAGILPVVAMGNQGSNGEDPGYPASVPAALTVGAVNDAGALAAYSGRGTNDILKPDLLAPGGGLLPEAGRIRCADNEPNDTYADRHGTSLAAAHVAAGACLLLEAFRKEGLPAPLDGAGPQLLMALLKSSAAAVMSEETADGQGIQSLWPPSGPDIYRGWGALQIQAAVEAALRSLMPGATLVDSLGGADKRQVLARRLPLLAGESCRIEVVPGPGLDVALELHDALWLLEPQGGRQPLHSNAGGIGFPEHADITGTRGGMPYLVVKRLSGNGTLTVRAVAEEGTSARAFAVRLNGEISGQLNSGWFVGTEGPTLVMASSADIDPFGRLIHAFDAYGRQRPGWPVALFLPGSLQGPLSSPLLWDLDGLAGDEVVLASNFGRVYYITAQGVATERTVAASDVALTAPVGLLTAGGERKLLLGGSKGSLYRLNASATPESSTSLGLARLLPPAVGELTADPGEEAAVLTAAGDLYVLDGAGQILPGWPISLGAGEVKAPLLVDMNGDGRHEVVVPLLPAVGSATLTFRVLAGDASPAPQDGAAVAAPQGVWLAVSHPAVSGSPAAPSVVVSGLVSNGASGAAERWSLALASLSREGPGAAAPMPGLDVRVQVPIGHLALSRILLPVPLAWDFHIGDGCEVEAYVLVGWEEEISGFPSLKGAAAAWFRPDPTAQPLSGRTSFWVGGPQADLNGQAGGALYTTGGGIWWRATYQRRNLVVQRAAGPWRANTPWPLCRGDGRNSGAYPLPPAAPTGVAEEPSLLPPRLAVWPNPSGSVLRVQWRGLTTAPVRLTVYDLRGRRVRSLQVGRQGEGELVWDTRDATGRPVAAGTYLFVLEHGAGRLTGRASVTR